MKSLFSFLVLFLCLSTCLSYSYPASSYHKSHYGRNDYHPTKSYYGQKSKAVYKPTKSTYKSTSKSSNKQVSKVPLCTTGTTSLTVLVKYQINGAVIKDAVIWIKDSKDMKPFHTNGKGNVKVAVTGCSVGITVGTGGQPVYRHVDLTSCTSREEKVVVEIGKKCDFTVFFSEKDNSEEYSLCTYMYVSGANTGEGVADCEPYLCVKAGETGEKFKMITSSQSGNWYNYGEMIITDARVINILVPPKVDIQLDLLINLNIFEDSDEQDTYEWNGVMVWSETAVLDDSALWLEDDYCFGIKDNVLSDQNYLIVVQFEEAADEENLLGNAALIDGESNVASVVINGETYVADNWWVLGCLCNGDVDSFVPVNSFISDDAKNGITNSGRCNSLCM